MAFTDDVKKSLKEKRIYDSSGNQHGSYTMTDEGAVKTDLIPKLKLNNVANSFTESLKAINNNPIAQKINTLGVGIQKGLGIGLIDDFLNPEVAKENEEQLKQSPVTALVGEGIGSLLPFGKVGKVISKIPLLKTIPKTTLGRFGQGALKGGIEGALVGGAYEGARGLADYMNNGGSLSDIGNRALNGATSFGLLGAGFGGGASALGKYSLPLIGGTIGGTMASNNQDATPTDIAKGVLIGGLIGGTPLLAKGGESLYNKLPSVINKNIDTKMNQYISNGITGNLKPMASAKNVATELNLRPSKDVGNINSRSVIENSPEMPLNSIQAEPLKLNLQNHSSMPNNQIEAPLLPTIDRIVDSTDKIGLKQKASDLWDKFYTGFMDTQRNIKPFSDVTGNNAYINATNTKKVGGTVNYILTDGLVDGQGKKIGESLRSIGLDIPKAKETEFMDYMLHRHNLDRFTEGKPVFPDYNDSQSLQVVRDYESQSPEFKDIANRLDKFMDKFRNTWLRDSGLVSKEVADEWAKKYPNYIPTYRKFSELEKSSMGNGAKRGYVDQVAPVRKATGSSRDIINPLESVMQMVNKTVRVAKRNEVGQEIVRAIRKNPEQLKQYAEILPANKAEMDAMQNAIKTDTIEGGLESIENSFTNPFVLKSKYDNVVTVLFDGKPVFLKINNKRFLDSVKALYEGDSQGFKPAQAVSNLFKTVVTQKNPIFAVKNVMRDLPTAYVYGSEKNPIRFGKNYLSAVKDVALNKEPYQQYKALGGQNSGFFNPKDVTLSKDKLIKPKNVITKIGDFFETVNQATETAPRLAEFKKILTQTGDVQKALYGAGEVTTNFSRSGSKSKSVEAWVPYFNASMQGLDKLVRSVIENPTGFVVKGAIATTIPTALQEIWNNSTDPKSYQDLDNRTKDAYFVFAKGNGEFLKIPKSRELGVIFSTLFQRLARQMQGDSGAWNGIGNTVATNFSPTNPIENNILAPAVLNLRSNKDFANRPIVPEYMKDLSPKYQYDEKTSEIAKWLGETAGNVIEGGLSPKQVDYIIRSYTGIIGQMLQPSTTVNGNPSKVLTTAFGSDVAYSNQATTDFYDNLNKLTVIAKDKNFTGNIDSEEVTPEEQQKNAFATASKFMTYLRNQAKQGSEEDKRQANIEILNIAKKMNKSLLIEQKPKDLLKELKPKGYKN